MPETARKGLLALAIRRPIGVTMILLALLVFGLVGYKDLPITLLPDLSYPTVTIRTGMEGAGPEDIEERISEPIREAVSVLGSVVRTTSMSRAGRSDVLVEFAWGTPMVHAVADIREKLDRVFLPEEADEPLVLRYDPSLDPIMVLGLSGEMGLRELRMLAEDEIERELAEIDGVAAVKIKGGEEREILIAVDPDLLAGIGLDIATVASRLRAENMNASAGVLEEGETEYLVRALNEFRSLEEIRNLIVDRRGGRPIRLSEIARVSSGSKDVEVITRIDGKPAVLIEVFKEAEANLVGLAARLRARSFGTEEQLAFVARLRSGAEARSPEDGKGGKRRGGRRAFLKKRMTDFIAYRLPKGVGMTLLSDPSRYIEGSIAEVLGSAVLGGLLAVFVLYLFLRSARPTFLISLSIPVSLIITFAPLKMYGVTLNIMSLGGLALGVGMLVDTSIVVLESITRCREEGDGLLESAFRGVREVSTAVVASTATTIAVFLPIVFVEGVAGQLFRDQALAVVCSLGVSLFVALFVLPMLASRGGDGAAPSDPGAEETPREAGLVSRSAGALVAFLGHSFRGFAGVLASLFHFGFLPLLLLFERTYRPIERAYPGLLGAALRARAAVLLLAAAALGAALYRIPSLGAEVLPQVHQGEFEVLVFLPRDVDVENTDRTLRPIERAIRAFPEVERTYLVCGVGREELRGPEEGRHSGRIRVILDPGLDPVTAEERTRKRIRGILEEVPEILDFRFQTPTLFTMRTPVSVEVLGHDLRTLKRIADEVALRMRALPSLRDVRSSLSRGNTEIVIRFDREKLSSLGLEIGEVADRMQAMVRGEVPTRYTDREKKIDMRVRLDPEELHGIDRLRKLDLGIDGKAPIPLESIAEIRLKEGPSEIRRLGGRRGVEIEATLEGFSLSAAQREVEEAVFGLDVPPGFEIRLGGQKEEMERSGSGMAQALALAIFLVYVIMAAQFESLVQPLVILFSVPLAVVGVVPALDLLGLPISVVVFLGAIMLAGIVVNNAIVMIDRMNQERAAGKDLMSAVRDGAAVRLRPVLMTTTTTVLGLLPLSGWLPSLPYLGAAGEGVELRAPMAVTVIAGLLSSTLLTLFVIPVLYSFLAGKRPRHPGDPQGS